MSKNRESRPLKSPLMMMKLANGQKVPAKLVRKEGKVEIVPAEEENRVNGTREGDRAG